MMLKSFNAQKAINAAVICHFCTYAPTHALGRDDGLHRSRRGGNRVNGPAFQMRGSAHKRGNFARAAALVAFLERETILG